MATTETIRMAAPAPLAVETFRSGRADDRLTDLLAFGLATEGGDAADADTVARRRAEAERLLTEHAFRVLHNRVEEIRRDAVAERLAALRSPPGFGRLVLANLVAFAVIAALGGWLAGYGPEDVARLAALRGGQG